MAMAGKASTPGRVVVYPNREKAASKLTKLIVTGLLVASAVLMALITLAGWSELKGMKPLDFALIIIYLILAYYVLARWSRGALTMGAGLAMLMLIVISIAAFGLAGTSWFARDSSGFAAPQSLFGGELFGSAVLGTLTVLLIPVQGAVIGFTMIAFAQSWNIESETSIDEAEDRGYQIPESAQPSSA